MQTPTTPTSWTTALAMEPEVHGPPVPGVGVSELGVSEGAIPEPMEAETVPEVSEAETEVPVGAGGAGGAGEAEVDRPVPIPEHAVQREDGGGLGGLRSFVPATDAELMSGLMMAAGVGIVVSVLLRNLRKRSRRRAQSPEWDTPEERIEEIRGEAARRGRASAEMAAAETEDIARRLAAVLDNKAAKLEILLDEADRRIAALEAAQAGAREPAQAERVVDEADAGEGASNGRSFEPGDHDPVHRLADEGVEPVEIAQRLGRPVGEVELILALRR